MQRQVTDLSERLRGIAEDYLTPNEQEQDYKNNVQRIIVEEIIQKRASKYLTSPFFAGSSYELVGVPSISDYDIQFGIKFDEYVTVEDGPESDWKKVKGGPKEFLEGEYMSVKKVRQTMHGVLQRALNDYEVERPCSNARIQLITNGPAITFDINNGKPSVDIVICVKSKNLVDRFRRPCTFDLVAKPFHKDDLSRDTLLWRTSYSVQEKERLYRFNRPRYCALTVYRIMKVVRSKNAQLRGLPSYFYKNAFFILLERYELQESAWTGNDSLAMRFRELLEVIVAALDKGDLRMYYDRNVNLLRGYLPVSLAGVKSYLESCLREINLGNLLFNL